MSKMSRNVAPMWVVRLIIAVAIAGLAPSGAWAQAPGQTWTQSGMLRCRLNPSIGFVIFGHQSMECQFVSSHGGAPQRYEARSIRSASTGQALAAWIVQLTRRRRLTAVPSNGFGLIGGCRLTRALDGAFVCSSYLSDSFKSSGRTGPSIQRERLSMTGDIMSDTILAYLISLGLIGTGVIWIVAGTNSTTSAPSAAIGVLTIAVGLISLLNEFHHRAYWR
jgi:hypothetical protein